MKTDLYIWEFPDSIAPPWVGFVMLDEENPDPVHLAHLLFAETWPSEANLQLGETVKLRIHENGVCYNAVCSVQFIEHVYTETEFDPDDPWVPTEEFVRQVHARVQHMDEGFPDPRKEDREVPSTS